MGLSISEIARDHATFIHQELDKYEQQLQPSSSEDEELVRRAVFSVRNKSVRFERFIPFSTVLYTIVHDVRAAEVTVDFRRELIHCSCPQPDICRHKVGVMLAMYQYFGSVQDWSSKWRAKKSVQLNTLANERSPENWQRMVDEVLGHLMQDDRRIEAYLVASLVDAARTKLRRHMPFEREWQPLYKLFIELAMLNKVWAQMIKTNSPIQSDYFQYFVDKSLETIEAYVLELETKSRLFATDPFYDALQEMVRTLVLQEKGVPHLRLKIYLLFWSHVFTENRRIVAELHAIEALRFVETDVAIDALSVPFYVLTKEDEALQKALTNVSPEQVDTYITIANFAQNHYHISSSALILKAILPHLEKFIHQTLLPMRRQLFTRTVDQLYAKIELTEEEELMLYSAYGKYGVQPFSEYLIRQKRFEDWAALHQLYPSSISHLDACGLKIALAEAPEVTLPLYHYYAMDEVRQKSRMNYKQAVRIWRSMKSASKKAGKMTFWHDYIQAVRQNYKRLRALQEEIDKSNLLT